MNRMEKMTWDMLTKAMAVLGAALIAAMMITGCSLADEDGSGARVRQGSAIVFGTEGAGLSLHDGTATTRTPQGTMTLGGAAGTESLRDRGFGVFAAHTGMYKYASSTVSPNLMYNQQVTFDPSAGTGGEWVYSPIVYWPAGEDGNESYVSFFAYGPYSDGSAGDERDCITDFSLPSESGDPWLVYRLGGTEQADGYLGWKAAQQDLVYAFRKDLTRGDGADTKVAFDFRHALASIGDEVTLKCDPEVEARLRALYTTSEVSLTVSRITLDYQLTPKGKLVLNNAGTANWQSISSGDALVHRYLTFSPDRVMARATSPTSATTADFSSGAGHGIFYIPLDNGSNRQKVSVTADYAISSGDPSEIFDSGTATVSADLSFVYGASEGRNLSLSFRLPDDPCNGTPLNLATTGMVVCSHGKAHAATTGTLDCGGEKVAVVAYRGTLTGMEAPYTNGLAVALADHGTQMWDVAPATTVAYSYADGLVTGAHPAGTSRWFLADAAQWALVLRALTGAEGAITAEPSAAYTAEAVSGHLTAAGGTALSAAPYWTATEDAADAAMATAVDLATGCTVAVAKTSAARLRPVLAF